VLTRTRLLAAAPGALAALLFFSGHASSQNPARATVDSYARLSELFADPPAEYRTFPFMVWNGEVTEAEIDRHLADFHEQGAGGVFIHPRPGMITEYLSGRWFQLSRYTVDQAKKAGMEVWLYDENSYPSGFAGGHVPAQMPESFNQGQGLLPEKVKRVDAASAGKYRLILKREGAGFREVPAAEAQSEGDYWAFLLAYYPQRAWHGGFSYVDLIRPGVTEKFIELTMPGYEKSIGSEFGKTVPGIFTDEPNINPPLRGALRWTPDLFEQFQKRWRYDLKPLLPALYEEVADWRKVRHDYYALLLDLYIERWSKPWRRYTDARHLQWTGHYWEHTWPNPAQGPDNMAMYAWHHVPGIDMLFNQFAEGVDAQFGNVRSVKELASVANQMGARRTLSETYGGGGWELRFEDMKRLGDWEYALGVNLMNQHLAYETIAGSRKYDYPQSFTYHEPWWKHYRVLGDYFGRLSLALASGEQVNRVLVLEPTTSAWLYASPGEPRPRMMEIGREFQQFVTRLESLQGEYDLGSENIIKHHGSVVGKRLAVGKRSYDLVVLPPGTENLDVAVVRMLSYYVQHGGTVLSFVDAPARADGATDARLAKVAATHPAQWLRAGSLDDPAAKQRLLGGDFRQVSGHLFHQRRQLQDGQLLFFVNSSLEQPAGATVSVKGRSLVRLDLFTGAREIYPAHSEGDALVFTVALAPGGSLLVAATSAAVDAASPPAASSEQALLSPPGLPAKRVAPNVLRIDYCDLRIGAENDPDLYFYAAQEKVFRHFGLGTNPWNTAVQYKTSILDKNHFPPGSGFDASFSFEVDGGLDRSRLQAVVERPALWHVSVNGRLVESRPGEWWLDRAFGVYDIGPYVKPGANVLSLQAEQMSVHHELEPVFVLGDFAATAADRGFKLTPPAPVRPGSWKDQGMPFYPNAVSYSRTVDLERRDGRYLVRLAKWHGTVAEVRVNGKPGGIIGWQPYEADITRLLRDGGNEVEVVVYGSLKNLLGPHHGKITRGLTAPGSFRTAPEHMPPGSAYDMEAYGLMEDFRIVQVAGPPGN
jgi:hypothetical protein